MSFTIIITKIELDQYKGYVSRKIECFWIEFVRMTAIMVCISSFWRHVMVVRRSDLFIIIVMRRGWQRIE